MFQLGQRLAIINRGRNHFTNTKTGEVVVQDLPQPQTNHLTNRRARHPHFDTRRACESQKLKGCLLGSFTN